MVFETNIICFGHMKHMKKKPNSQDECGVGECGGIIVCGLLPPPADSFHRLRAVPLPRRGRSWGIRRSKPAALPSIGYRGFAVSPKPLRASSRSRLYSPGDERARNARPYRVRRCSRRLQTHLTVAMMQPSVANASHRCDFCHVVGARIARPSIFRKLSIFPSHTSLLEGGGPPRGRWKEFSGAGRRSSPLLLCRTSFYFPAHVRHTRHKKHMKHTRNRS